MDAIADLNYNARSTDVGKRQRERRAERDEAVPVRNSVALPGNVAGHDYKEWVEIACARVFGNVASR